MGACRTPKGAVLCRRVGQRLTKAWQHVCVRCIAADGSRHKSGVSLPVVRYRNLYSDIKDHDVPNSSPFNTTLTLTMSPPNRNKDGFLTFGEFKAALAPLQTRMSPSEIRALFAHLEAEAYICARGGVGSTIGVTSCQALLDAIRAPLSGERLGIVRLAFRRMDINGEGRLSPETLAQRW